MALRRAPSNRLLSINHNKLDTTSSYHFGGLKPSTTAFSKTSPGSPKSSPFRRWLQQQRGINQVAPAKLPEFLSIPVGDKLREKLWSINIPGDRARFDGIVPPPAVPKIGGISASDVRKILRSAQLDKVRQRLREIPSNSIAYGDYVMICGEACENREQGLEFAKKLDDAGSVIIVGNVVFLRPHQLAMSVEKMISESIAAANDPRRRELDQMEKQKAIIDQKAESQVKAELYCGLGYLVVQTLGFMRLTFWELSWDVMEPICFFVTSLHFALAYGFFLRTSKEPSFEGYFQRRFKAKRSRLMKIHNFDIDKYNELRRVFYPSCYDTRASSFNHVYNHGIMDHASGAAAFGPVQG